LELHKDIVALVASLIGSAVAALLSFLVAYKQRLERKKKERLEKELSESLRVSLSKSYQDYLGKYAEFAYLDKDGYIKLLRDSLAHYPSLETKADIKEQVNASVNELENRIKAIEARFPQEATLEKIASVNDAILATQLDAMSNSIKDIKDKMLTKWDVVKIAFAILAALGGISAIIFGILNLVKT